MSNASKVYFAGMRARNEGDSKIKKIARLFNKANFKELLGKDDLCAIKVHFGERGNDTFVNPVFVRAVVDKIKESKAKPFITDTNTLYKGSRHNSVDHLLTALEHGFSYATVAAPLIIADGLRSHGFVDVPIGKKHFADVKIAESIYHSDCMFVISHFKGHPMAGFGGAIKNLAMGCAPARGKKEQHSSKFDIDAEKCTSCGQCVAHCPEDAIIWKKNENKKYAFIQQEKCIGCGECLTMCDFGAVSLDWETGYGEFIERMVEYAHGAAKSCDGKTAYFNILMNITPDCDCASWSDQPIVPDIGILASHDPVALDKACFDLVNAQPGFKDSQLTHNHGTGEDKFKGANNKTLGEIQFSYAESIGMGSTSYELIEV